MCSKTYSGKNASQYTGKVGRYGPFQNFIFAKFKASLRPEKYGGIQKIYRAKHFLAILLGHSALWLFRYPTVPFLCLKVLFLLFGVKLWCRIKFLFLKSFNMRNSPELLLVLCICGKAQERVANYLFSL